jgi:hypothetical protein
MLFKMCVCSDITASIPTFVAGLQKSFRLIVLYLAIEDIEIIRILLQKQDPIDNFSFGTFQLHLDHEPDDFICKYTVLH